MSGVRKRQLPQGSFTAEVTALDHEGRGVARIDGKVTFIADALPGETVQFKYLSQRRDKDEGQVVSVTVASPDRVTPPCKHFGLCGGCVLQHLAPAKQIEWKQHELLQTLQRIGRRGAVRFELGARRRRQHGAPRAPLGVREVETARRAENVAVKTERLPVGGRAEEDRHDSMAGES